MAEPKTPIRSAPAEASPPRRVLGPPEPYDHWRMWSSLLISVLVCLPPLLINLGAADVGDSRESLTLLAARETWQNAHAGQKLAWVVPTANNKPQLDHPPMSVWLTMASWSNLDPTNVRSDVLVWRARLVTVALAVLALLSTYWAGVSIGGIRVARVATMALGTTLLFIDQMRYASPEAQVLGWTTLSIAAGLWAMRPLKPINWVGRRVSGWLIAGLALGAAVMTIGWTGAIFVLPPLVAAILLTPNRRVGNTIGLIFAIILGFIAAAPWYLYVFEQTPDLAKQFFSGISVPPALFLLTWSHARVVAVLSPWQIWLIGAALQPFIRAERERRRQLLIAWFWFVLIFVAFSIPAAHHPRYLVPLLPAAGLMIGQLWAYHAHLAIERQEEPGINLLRVPHWLLLTAASILGPLFIAFQPELVQRGYLDQVELPGIGWPIALALGVVLILIVMMGARWHFKWRPRMAAYATVAWMVVASTVAMGAFAESHHNRNQHRADAEHLTAMASDHQVVYLQRTPNDTAPDEAFLFYAGRTIAPITPEQLDDLAKQPQAVFVIAHADQATDKLMMDHGFEQEFNLADVSPQRRVYRTMDR